MKRAWILVLALAISVGLTIPAQLVKAQDAVEFKSKHDGAKSYKTTSTAKTSQTMSFMGRDIETSSETTEKTSRTVLPANDKGQVGLKIKTDSIKFEMGFAGQTITFDSTKPETRESPVPQLQGILDVLSFKSDAEVTYRFDKEGGLSGVENADKLLDKAPEAIRDNLKDSVNEKALVKQFTERFAFLPKKPVKKGDKWTVKSVNDSGQGQAMETEVEYSYSGQTDHQGKKVDKFEGKLKSLSLLSKENANGPKIDKSDLKPVESTYTILYDRETGIKLSSKSTVRAEGNLSMSAMGQEIALDVKMLIEEDESTSDIK